MSELHMGPIMDKREGWERHCETVLPNHACPYLAMGCLGCTRKSAVASDAPAPSLTLTTLQQAFDRLAMAGLYTDPAPAPRKYTRPSFLSDCES